MQTVSNIKQKPTKLRIIQMLLLLFIAVQFTNPITARAEDNSKSYNGTDAGEGASVGSLYWGGSTERSGIIMYIYDTVNKEIMKSGNVEEYFFQEVTLGSNTITRWEFLIYDKFGAEALVELKGNQNLILVVEPIACQAVYSTQTWGSDEAAQEYIDNQLAMFGDKHTDNDYVKWLQKYKEQNGIMATVPKPAIISGHIKRVSATGRNAAYQAQSIIRNCFGKEERDKCSSGGANWKWTNQALPYCMVLERDFNNITAITDNYPTRKTSDEFYDKNKGYALSIFDEELKADYISTYDGTSEEPAPSEQPVKTKEKDTTGDVTIVKMYYHATVDDLTGDITWENTTKTTKGTTGYIVAQDETDKTTYRLQIWGTVSDEQSFVGYF